MVLFGPRTITQAKSLDAMFEENISIDHVLEIEIF